MKYLALRIVGTVLFAAIGFFGGAFVSIVTGDIETGRTNTTGAYVVWGIAAVLVGLCWWL